MSIGTHTSHCCKRHGCKYGYSLHGDKVCPVEAGTHEQEYPCGSCIPTADLRAKITRLQEELAFSEEMEKKHGTWIGNGW